MRLLRRPSLTLTLLIIITIVLIQQLNLNPFSKSPYYGQTTQLYDPNVFEPGVAKPAGSNYSRVLVMGHLQSEDVSWVARELPEFDTHIYVVDKPDPITSDHDPSRLPANKGHEAMVYLTYIIDHYTSLPDVVLFFHPHRIAWHNNILLDLDTVKTIKLISSPHVVRQGYFNSRCHLDPGCPDWLHVDRPRWRWDLHRKPEEPVLTSELFRELHGPNQHTDPTWHPPVQLPAHISQPCCAQFAVSGDRIRARPRDFYIRYRDWILATPLDDKTSGRLLEYSWQYMFTGNFEFCPNMHHCYCDGYGLCFEGDAGLEHWLRVLRVREKVDEKRVKLHDRGQADGEKYKALLAESNRLTDELDHLRELALIRGFDPRIRAQEVGRVWHEGDGF
ncbi:hypothetical protein PV10_00054 [Exophiala mesophila]|uniref:DUF3431 domain-containing protein n=1 Tax=Exophiala mesophila TaxID=212818 RepID=A0A0D1Y649_EXOME|nr:uncharacterized protein PV10_00054 [Exophiala mesophila]KIV96151.1 hypothetical protein PV10_00054 [Exophiala mesophila]